MALSAVSTVVSGAVSGASGEAGRRLSERLYDLLSRGRPGGNPGPTAGGSPQPTLPETESQQTAAARQLLELARRSPEFAHEVTDWVREAAWLSPRTVPAVAHAASRPQMLPPTTAVFTDRAEVLAWLTGLLDEEERPPGAPVVAVLRTCAPPPHTTRPTRTASA
ncbi:hypothetical protein ACQ4WX_32985 [Streptomyces lasalocidi]